MSFFDDPNENKTTPPFFVKANQVTNVATLAADTDKDAAPYTAVVTSAVGINIGDYCGLFSLTNNRYYVAYILNITGTTLTFDTPLDADFSSGDTVGTGFTNMKVDGSVTPEVFSVRGADTGVQITVDITRILFTCITTTALQLTDFGDITGGLTRGLVIRRMDGLTQNHLNFKTNIEMKGWMLDWQNLDDSNPGQGLHGFVARLTYNGKEKLDTAIRIGPGEELQFIVQDDLTSLISFEVMLEGSQTVIDSCG